jgi:hypothetical protein
VKIRIAPSSGIASQNPNDGILETSEGISYFHNKK